MNLAGLITGPMHDSAGPEIAFLAVLAGSIAGFLVYNFPPASIFMGDCGSLLLGFSLATFTLNHAGVRGSRSDVLAVIAGPIFVLLIPIFDTTLVTVARLMSGRSPAVGGRDHASHRLVAIGLSERNAVFLLWLLAAIGGAIGIALRNASGGGWSLAVGAVFLLAMGGFAVYLVKVRVYDETVTAPGFSDFMTPLVGDFMHKRRAAEVLIDLVLIVAAYYQANRLRLGPYAYLDNAGNFYNSLPLVVATQLLSFFVVGVYRGSSRPFEWRDSLTIAKGVVFGAASAQLAILYIYLYFSYSRSVFAIYAVLLFALVIASRQLLRAMGRLLP
jgi:UDP-GlcNAc:undecaprenyl-phosphate GlcNAc-1-phosphate transferase